MIRHWWFVAAVAGSACRSTTPLFHDAGNPDAAVDAAPPDAPPDAPSPYSISIGDPQVVASALISRSVAITGNPNDQVQLAIARPMMGAPLGELTPLRLTLDANGSGTATYTPCTDVTPLCDGPATLTLALASTPDVLVAHDNIYLDAPNEVGEVAPCRTGGNVMYLHGNDGVFTGVLQTGPSSSWTAVTYPDQIEFDLASPGYRGIFTLADVPTPFEPGLYEQAMRAEFADPGHPGLHVGPGGCNHIDGRFYVYDYVADPILGTVYSVTISFEQVCDNMQGVLVGCFHYESQPVTPPAPLPPDPNKVSVQVLSTTYNGSPDTTATAIFTDSTGTVVLDTQVDAFGEAQAALPNGGTLTTIQHAGGHEYIHSYRGVVTGNHVVVNGGGPTTGAKDQVLVSFAPPTDMMGTKANNLGFITACGGGSWSSGTGPLSADLAFYDGCRASTFSMLSVASFSDGQPQEFVWQPGLAHLANGNVEVATDWAPMGKAMLTLANVPANSLAIHATWSTKIDASPVQMDSQVVNGPMAGNQTLLMNYAPGAGDGAIAAVSMSPNGISNEGRSVVATGAPSSVTVDFASQPIPLVSAMQTTATGASWTETPGGTADVRTVIWCGTLQNGPRVIWVLVEPYDGQASTTLPSLPPAHAAEDPTVDPGATLYGSAVTYVDYDVVSGFTLTPPSGAYASHSSNTETFSMQFPF